MHLDLLLKIHLLVLMFQYSFPPSCVGEVGRIGAPSRREIGHGMLAERALEPILPSENDFPYTVRVESTITESNGSSRSEAIKSANVLVIQLDYGPDLWQHLLTFDIILMGAKTLLSVLVLHVEYLLCVFGSYYLVPIIEQHGLCLWRLLGTTRCWCSCEMYDCWHSNGYGSRHWGIWGRWNTTHSVWHNRIRRCFWRYGFQGNT